MTNWPACGLLSCIRRQALVKRKLNQEGWWWHRQWKWRLPSLFSPSLSQFWFQPDETALPGRQSQAQFHSQSGRSRCRAGRREKGFPTKLSWKLSKLVHNADLKIGIGYWLLKSMGPIWGLTSSWPFWPACMHVVWFWSLTLIHDAWSWILIHACMHDPWSFTLIQACMWCMMYIYPWCMYQWWGVPRAWRSRTQRADCSIIVK